MKKFRRVRNPYGTGLVWLIVHEDGREETTISAASGRGMFKRSQMERDYNGTKARVS